MPEYEQATGTVTWTTSTTTDAPQPGATARLWPGRLSACQRTIKRVFDVCAGTLLALLATPLLALIALAIRLESRGAVLYRQRRVGENGRTFWMLKFRSMVADAETRQSEINRQAGAETLFFKDADDPRVTRIGRFLRRTSLDELPQLYNVLKGDMSLVGPRPELPYLLAHYAPWQLERLCVPQGMTGWWQIRRRGEQPMYLHTEEDLYYVRHYSFWLDLLILARTPLALLNDQPGC